MKNHRLYESGTFERLGEKITEDGLNLAPMGETVSFIRPAYKGVLSFLPFGDGRKIRRGMKTGFIYASTDIHYFPENVVFYHDFRRLDDRFENPTQEQLEGMMGSREEKGVVFSSDGSLRMVKGKHSSGELKKGTLSSHPNIIGQTGSLKSAYELDEIASTRKHNPYLDLLQNLDYPQTEVSALYSRGDLDDGPIVCGHLVSVWNWDAYAFGVPNKTGKGK